MPGTERHEEDQRQAEHEEQRDPEVRVLKGVERGHGADLTVEHRRRRALRAVRVETTRRRVLGQLAETQRRDRVETPDVL